MTPSDTSGSLGLLLLTVVAFRWEFVYFEPQDSFIGRRSITVGLGRIGSVHFQICDVGLHVGWRGQYRRSAR
jgi:hypothetical protein